MARKCLSDSEWLRLQPLLPAPKPTGRPPKEDRLVVEGILWVLRTGAPWRDLPDEFGNWRTVYSRFYRWATTGVMKAVFGALAEDYDGEWVLVDSTIVRAHQHAAGGTGGKEENAIGRSRGGLSTKIHAASDGLGNPIRIGLSGGHSHDITQAEALIEGTSAMFVIADKAYDANAFIEAIERSGAQAVIPPRHTRNEQRVYDKHLYKQRYRIECMFSRLKQFRRVATRYEKLALTFLSMVYLGCILGWLA